MMMKPALLALACMAATSAFAQKTSIEAIEEYRAMLADGNPADLFEAKGEALWKQKRGPKNASLEACDLGKGPGVVKGARFVHGDTVRGCEEDDVASAQRLA